MMNEAQHLLVCLMEECAEVQHAAAKALRFGIHDSYKDYGHNQERLVAEVVDFLAIADLLADRGILPKPPDFGTLLEAKRAKVLKFMEYAREKGELA